MKRILNLLLTFVLLLSFTPISASDNELNIVFTHDMHDNLDAYTMIENGVTHSRGGFARLKTAIDQEREKDQDLLLLDAGDYSMGTLYQSIFETHSPALRLMTLLNYDATTFGNHEFDFRTEGLANSLVSAKKGLDNPVPIIASNTKFPEHKNLDILKDAFAEYGVIEDYLIINKKGYKIALIGLMGEEADSYSPTAEVIFNNYIEEAKELVKTIKDKENPDIIIALSHSGTDNKNPKASEDELLAKAVPDIDVIISGHSHTTLNEPIIHGSTVIASSGRYTENIGVMSLSKDGDRWKLNSYEIKALKDNYAQDISINQELTFYKNAVKEEYLAPYGLEYDEVLTHSDFDFTPAKDLGEKLEEEPLGYLIADAYIHAAKELGIDDIDIAVVPYGVIRDSITKGDITTKDAFKISSLGIGKDGLSGYPLISAYVSGKDLKTAAEVDASIQPLQKVAQLYIANMKYKLNTKRIIFNKVTDTKLIKDNELVEIEDNKLYRIVANLYTAQMLGLVESQSKGLLSITPVDVNGNVIENFEDHIIYDGNNEELKEWVALTTYLKSFGEDGISEEYNTTHGYKEIVSDASIGAILSKPNKIALAIYAIIIITLILILLLIRWIIRKLKK